MTVLVCSWRRREKTKGSHDMKSGNTNSMASSRPMAVPNTSQSAVTTKKLRAALSSARNSRWPRLPPCRVVAALPGDPGAASMASPSLPAVPGGAQGSTRWRARQITARLRGRRPPRLRPHSFEAPCSIIYSAAAALNVELATGCGSSGLGHELAGGGRAGVHFFQGELAVDETGDAPDGGQARSALSLIHIS